MAAFAVSRPNNRRLLLNKGVSGAQVSEEDFLKGLSENAAGPDIINWWKISRAGGMSYEDCLLMLHDVIEDELIRRRLAS